MRDRPWTVALRQAVLGNADALARLEGILHPMVEHKERAFVAAPAAGGSAPWCWTSLLFGRRRAPGRSCGCRVCPRSVQIQRVRGRRRMNAADIAAVIARQMPDAEKRRRADVVVNTGLSRHHALRTLSRLIREVLA
jgi:dephospho-CoA kinase